MISAECEAVGGKDSGTFRSKELVLRETARKSSGILTSKGK